jgi:hypothetical protein
MRGIDPRRSPAEHGHVPNKAVATRTGDRSAQTLRRQRLHGAVLLQQEEPLKRRPWRTKVEFAIATAGYIEQSYNPARRHSSLGCITAGVDN